MAWKAITVWGMDDNVGPVVLETMIEESACVAVGSSMKHSVICSAS